MITRHVANIESHKWLHSTHVARRSCLMETLMGLYTVDPTLPDDWPHSYRAMVKSLKNSGEITDDDLSHPQGPVFAHLQRSSKATMASIMVNAINSSHKKNMVQVPKAPTAPHML